MKKIFLTLAAVGALAAAAAPAVAQPYGYDGRYDRGWDNRYDRDGRYDRGWDNRYDRGDHRMLSRIALERVGRAADSGALNPWEARRLTAEARDF